MPPYADTKIGAEPLSAVDDVASARYYGERGELREPHPWRIRPTARPGKQIE